MKNPVFILGVGAQKAGTSWLYETFANQAFANMGFRKEYHIWNATEDELGQAFNRPIRKPDNSDQALRRLMRSNHDIYASYFRGLIEGQITLTGDISPSYSYLSSRSLQNIKNLLEGYGFNVKVIFLLRDPVERIWSAQRMIIRNNKRKQTDVETMIQKLPKFSRLNQNMIRSDYISTINNIEEIFEQNQIFYAIYENLFTKESISKLEYFIEHKINDVQFNTKVNESPKIALPENIFKRTINLYKDQYKFCNKKFPETNVLWHNINID